MQQVMRGKLIKALPVRASRIAINVSIDIMTRRAQLNYRVRAAIIDSPPSAGRVQPGPNCHLSNGGLVHVDCATSHADEALRSKMAWDVVVVYTRLELLTRDTPAKFIGRLRLEIPRWRIPGTAAPSFAEVRRFGRWEAMKI